MMRFFRSNNEALTRHLSSASFTLAEPERKRIARIVIPAVLLSACITYVAADQIRSSPESTARLQLAEAVKETERLQNELKLTQMRVQQEVATREELARQLEGLTQKLHAEETELEFLRRQRSTIRGPQSVPLSAASH